MVRQLDPLLWIGKFESLGWRAMEICRSTGWTDWLNSTRLT